MTETTERTQMRDVEAGGVPIQVVAVKWPDHWIIRGIYCFESANAVLRYVWPYVAVAPQDELEWTQHRYMLPSYLAYGTGDLPKIGWPGGGVYLFAHSNGVYHQEPTRRLDTVLPLVESSVNGRLAPETPYGE